MANLDNITNSYIPAEEQLLFGYEKLDGYLTYLATKKALYRPFKLEIELTRPADSTVYTVGDLINSVSATTLPELDFSAIAEVNGKVLVNSIVIQSDQNPATSKLSAQALFFNSNSLTGSTLTDNTAFAPSYSELKSKKCGRLEDISTSISFGTAGYEIMQADIQRIISLNSSAKAYLALIANNAYTPKSGEKILVTVKGFIL